MPFDNPVGINDPSGEYVYDAATWRRAQSGLMVHDADVLAPRTGVLHGLSVSVSGMNVQASPGQAVVGDTVGAMGAYVVVLPAAESVELDARDATFSRIDRVSVVVDDPEASGTERGARLVVEAGTPSVSPTPPAVPEGGLSLARVTVPPSGALSVVDDRRWTAMAGGTVRCTSTSRPSGGSLMPGQSIFETDTGRWSLWDGAAWRVVSSPSTDTGWVDLSGYLETGFTGTLSARAWGGLVEIRAAASGPYSGSSTDLASGIPSQFRPSVTTFGAGYIAGRVVTVFVRSNGSVAATVADDGTVSASMQGTIHFSK